MQKTKRFGKDFILVIIGQIISLFGNAVLRFALPLYLFDQTGSPTLLGLVSAGSFLPMVVLSPVGGIVADRVNKRNIMVVLDFSAAALIALFALALGRMPLVPLLMAVLLLLYGIQGAYQPAVQASIPLFGCAGAADACECGCEYGELAGKPSWPGTGRCALQLERLAADFICKLCMLCVFRCDGNIHPHPARFPWGWRQHLARRAEGYGTEPAVYFPGKACCGTHHFAGVLHSICS